MTLGQTDARPVHGYGLTIYNNGERDVCGFLDGSPVLAPTLIERTSGRDRLRFNEGTNPVGRAGDVFCADVEIAAFVRDAINEKIAREGGAEFDVNQIRIFGATVARIGGEDVCKIAAERLCDGETVSFDIVLQSPKQERQSAGQGCFSNLCWSANIDAIEDAEQLHGCTVTYRLVDGMPEFDRSPAPAKAA